MPPVPTSAPMKNVNTEERLHRADMKPMSKEVKQSRWRMIEHILRQDQNKNCNIAITWAPEGKRRRGRPKATWKRTVEKESWKGQKQDGNRGRKGRPLQLTEISGGTL